MPDRLIITEENQLKEVSIPETPQQPLVINLLAKFISFIFHPLFIPVYLTYFIFEVHSYQFAGINDWNKTLNLLLIIVTYAFIPMISVIACFVLKFLIPFF
jgi:hypothetical protein